MVTLCSSSQVIVKAGANASNVWTDGAVGLTGEDIVNQWIEEAEGVICAATSIDWVSKYSDIDANYQGIIEQTCSSIAAMEYLKYDMSGMSDVEAQNRLNVLNNAVIRGIGILNKSETKNNLGVQ